MSQQHNLNIRHPTTKGVVEQNCYLHLPTYSSIMHSTASTVCEATPHIHLKEYVE